MAVIVHLIKDVVKTVVNVVGDVVKGDFGHIDNDLAHGFEDVGKHIYTDVIKPIADDPLRFIATVAPYFIPGVGPIAGSVMSGVMNAGVGLAEGEKFGDALKSGAIAGVTGYAGGALAGEAFGSTAGKMSSAESKLWGEAAPGVTKSQSGLLTASTEASTTPIADLLFKSEPQTALGDALYGKNPYKSSMKPSTGWQPIDDATVASKTSGVPTAVVDDTYAVRDTRMPGDVPAPVTNAATEASAIDKAGSTSSWFESPAAAPVTDMSRVASTEDVASATKGAGSPGNMIWDGANWVMDNKIKTGLGLLALNELGKMGKGSGSDNSSTAALDNATYNAAFDQPLEQFSMGRDSNAYGGDLNKYAESGGGEFKFLSDPVYTTVPAAARGGYVKMADGGPVNQDPYNNNPYAAQPMPMPPLQGQGLQAMQGYADGGSVNPTDRERMMMQQQQLRSTFGGNPTEAERRIYAQQLQQLQQTQQQRNRSPLTGMQQQQLRSTFGGNPTEGERMMMQQQLRSTFGGNPTEGERRIYAQQLRSTFGGNPTDRERMIYAQQLRSAFGGNPTEGERRMMQGAGAGIQGYADGGSVVEYADPNVQQMPVAQGYQGSMPWGSSGTLPQGGPMSEADRQQMLQQLAPLTALSMKGAPPRPGAQQQGQQGQPVRPGTPQQGQPGTLSQMVAPSQQNPNYKYYGYGTVPQSVAPSQATGTLGGTMTQQERVRQQQRLHQQMLMQQQQGRHAKGGKIADGRSDDVPAMLSNGEYVMDAESVGLLGNGSSDAGAKKLDAMRAAIRKQKGQALAKGKISPNAKSPSKYLK